MTGISQLKRITKLEEGDEESLHNAVQREKDMETMKLRLRDVEEKKQMFKIYLAGVAEGDNRQMEERQHSKQ